MRAPLVGWLALATCAACATIIASCADSDPDPNATPPDDGGPVREASVDAAIADALPDATHAPCDAGDPSCTSVMLPCSMTDFCPVAGPISQSFTQYALNGVWGSSATNVYVVGAAGSVAHWDGTTFTLEKPLTTYTLNTIWGSGADDIWAASTPELILHRTATGWEKAPSAETNLFRLHAVVLRASWGPADGSTVFLGGDRLTKTSGDDPEIQLWRYAAGKTPWSAASQIPFFTVQGIWGSATDDYWVVGYVFQSGVMAYHVVPGSDPKAPSWIATDLQTTATMNAVWGSGPNDVWAVGELGTIRHHTGSSSARWDVVASPTSLTLRAIWGTSATDAWAAGDGGVLLHWNGTSWTRLVASFAPGINPDLYGLWGTSATDVWAVGASGTILRSAGVRTKAGGGKP